MVVSPVNETTAMRLDETAIKARVLTALWQDRRIAGGAAIANEFRVGNSGVRADLAVYSDRFIGIEIKSEFDSLKRLDRQIAVYNTYFDEVILVVGESHVRKIAFSECDGAEVWSVRADGTLQVVAESHRPVEIDYDRLADLMTATERTRFLRSGQRATPDEVREAFRSAFSARFAATSQKFWQATECPITPETLSLLSRFKRAREEHRLVAEANAHNWEAWNRQAAALFGT